MLKFLLTLVTRTHAPWHICTSVDISAERWVKLPPCVYDEDGNHGSSGRNWYIIRTSIYLGGNSACLI